MDVGPGALAVAALHIPSGGTPPQGVLDRIAGTPQSQLDQLLPWNWIPEQEFEQAAEIGLLPPLKTSAGPPLPTAQKQTGYPAAFGGCIPVIHSTAETMAAWPTSVTRSRWLWVRTPEQ